MWSLQLQGESGEIVEATDLEAVAADKVTVHRQDDPAGRHREQEGDHNPY